MLSGVLLLRPRGKGDPTLSIQSEPPRLFQPEHSCLCQVRDKEPLSNCGPIGVPCARGLPIDLSPRHEQLRMESVKGRPIVRRRKLQHVNPVEHEANSSVGVPVETKSEIRLTSALDAGADTERLLDEIAAAVEIDFAHPGSEFQRAPSACAQGIDDLDLAEGSR